MNEPIAQPDPDVPPLRIERDANGHVVVLRGDQRIEVTVSPCFPWSSPGRYLSLRDGENQEVALVKDLEDLDEDSASCLRTALQETRFVLEVESIEAIEKEFELRNWHVVTRQGTRKFQTRLDDWPRPLPDGSALVQDIQGFIFVSSANSTTPFHIDAEENFLLQIKGDKYLHVFDNEDRSLISEKDMEISPSKHRNQEYRADFEDRAQVFEMAEGDGAFLPYMWPHWVRTGGRYSISIAVTWKSPKVQRLNKIRFMNATLRNLGLPQAGPGHVPLWDGIKVAAYDAAHLMINPLRRSEWSRRLIRQLLFGRKANYYYEG